MPARLDSAGEDIVFLTMISFLNCLSGTLQSMIKDLAKGFYLCEAQPGQRLTETAMMMTTSSRTAKAMDRRQHFIFLARS